MIPASSLLDLLGQCDSCLTPASNSPTTPCTPAFPTQWLGPIPTQVSKAQHPDHGTYSNSREPSTTDHPTTSSVLSRLDVRQASGSVQPRVQESKRLLASQKSITVQQLHDTGESRGSTTRPVNTLGRSRDHNHVICRLCCNIWVRAARLVEVRSNTSMRGIRGQPLVDRRCLVAWLTKATGESSTGTRPRRLGAISRGTADCRHPRACSGERCRERLRATSLAGRPNARIS